MRVIGGITDANGSRCFYIMSELSEIFSYDGNEVTFKTINGTTYINATEMAKHFNRRPNDYLSLTSANELVSAITRKTGKSENQLVIKKTGMPAFGGGVWLHEDIAIDFAQWLSIDFKLWCADKIKELLLKGHTSINRNNSDISRNDLPSDYIEALEALLKSEKEKRALAEAKKAAEEAKRISDNIIKEQAPMVEFAKTAEIAQETDMLIREVREKLEAHGYDIAEKNLRILLEDNKFFAKTGKRWLLSQRMIDRGYARYRYRDDDEFYGTNTVYVTPKGFQWIVSKISREWMPRFLELKGRVLSRSDKNIFAKR